MTTRAPGKSSENINKKRDMKSIKPREVLYIKLGSGGEYEADCINNGTLQIDFREFSHEFYASCQKSGKWRDVQKAYRNRGKSAGTATNYEHQVQRFYEADEKDLWITFHKGALYWCFASLALKRRIKISKFGTRWMVGAARI
jgi:hypothetical protein